MDRSSLLSVPGNFESPQMHQLSEQLETIPSCEAARSMVTAETSITACKKVLCSNSLLDSAEYWLHNEKELCQVGFLEDKGRSNCPTICFVNLDGVDTNIKSKELQQKLDTVSPDLPHLINSLNVCQMKDNELILVRGLIAPGSCLDNANHSQVQKDESTKYLEEESVPPPAQCTRPPDVCLVQSARRCRKNDVACIIYEINKCMIGLNYFKGRKKHPVSTANWKSEEETNYSGSSIEEDFLTASEQFNDEQDEANNDLKDPLKINGFDTARGIKNTKAKSRVLLQMRQKTDNLFRQKACSLQDTSAYKCADEEIAGNVPLLCCEDNYVPAERDGERLKSERNVREEALALKTPHGNHFANSNVDEHNSYTIECAGACLQTNSAAALVDTWNTIDKHSSSPSPEENHCMEGAYASNLAESVLQDAFIRLSQSEPTFTTEAAVSISAESVDGLSPSDPKGSAANPSCPWNVLPKIVIVQSPDNSDNASEWQEPCRPITASCLDSDPLSETLGYAQEHNIDQNNSESTGLPPNSVEVALVYAANVVGTISSPYITESLQLDQALYDGRENLPCNRENGDGALPSDSECDNMNFSFSSALYGVTQVASAIGVAGLSDEPDVSFSVASSGLLSAAETSGAVALQCSVSVGSRIDTFAHNIAEVLFKEAATVLTKTDNYRSVGELMESVDQKITETVTRPNVSHWEELPKDDFALNMSNLILKHSFEEANSKVGMIYQEKENNLGVNPTNIFIESANKSLFSILYFTCRKIKDIVRHSDVTMLFQDDRIKNSKDSEITNIQEGISVNHNPNDRDENLNHVPSGRGNLTDSITSYEKRCVGPDLSQQINLNAMQSLSRRGSDCANIAHNLTNQLTSGNTGAAVTSTAVPQQQQNICDKDTTSSFSTDAFDMESRCGSGVQPRTSDYISTLTDTRAQPHPGKNQNNLMMNPQSTLSPSKSPFHVEKSTDTSLTVNGFADQISKTVVSMATEMAAICLENTNAKQPWFCPWKTRLCDHKRFIVPQASSSKALGRGKESQTTTVKRLKPPRLSEIKRKTQEQPELKEKLMNRVVDESLNSDDVLDQINNFAQEVTAKIVNSAELTVIDSVRQGQGLMRNRLLTDRWSRGKGSSYESIPEEDTDSNSSWAALGALTKFGQPNSRASSVSKQSSCESITDEFSNFMMNQMESEGWGFDLLLDYYASKHASNILNAALQQVCRKNGHLGVSTTCLSKQSSTESITEEFYRYMLHELEKESKETKANKEFHNMLVPPAGRGTSCFRQSSMPDRQASEGRLTVTPPVKANSFDGFAQNDRRNTLQVNLGNVPLSANLYKSLTDSCLYRKNKTDHITDMLISETWSNSIEALMRKNKIICDDADIQSAEQLSGGAQQFDKENPTNIVTDTIKSGKSISSSQQGSLATLTHDCGTESKICDSDLAHRVEEAKSVTDKKSFTSHEWAAVKKKKSSHCPREVPLIHIENDQKEERNQSSHGKAVSSTKRQAERKLLEADSEGQTESGSLVYSFMKNPITTEKATSEENPCSLSTSDDSMGSWSQLINEEDHAEDSSSYLHLSESNGNSSASSSLGLVDLDAYQENLSIRTLPSEIISEKDTVKENQESLDENTSQMALDTINCHMDFLVLNFDLSPECVDSELRAILQWIAASELGFPVIYFKKSQENRNQKFLDVIHFVDQKAWKLKDLFLAIIQFCELQEEGGRLPTCSLFDWLLEFG
ncbi:A-kinase anchor protein SPHKAP isoform X1 [Mobula hypostoma]|uniref:A-kinase anchor protein SPHKAP isoform X1 n=2 Tax=Mobula hypostoma TaxID=723540 RepID=UPI002FC33162